MFEKRSSLKSLLAIFTLALIARVFFILASASEERIYDSLYDQYVYLDLARSLLSGHGYSTSSDVFIASQGDPTSVEPPMYPLVLAGLLGIFGDRLLAVRLFNAVVSSVTCATVYLIGKRFFGQKAGLWAGALMLIYPLHIMYVRPIMPEPLYTLLVSLIVLLLLRPMDSFNNVHSLIGGLLAGIAFLTRAESLGFSLLAFGFRIWTLWRQQGVRFKEVAVRILLGLCGFVVIAVPWGIRNWAVQGKFHLLPTKKYVLWDLNWLRYKRETEPKWREYINAQYYAIPGFGSLSELERDQYLRRMAIDFISQNPAVFVKYAITRVANAYPIVPREMLPPPVGYLGVRERPVDNYPSSSLDDYPLYFRPAEKLRVWSFRVVLTCAFLATITLIRQRNWTVLAVALPLCFNVISSALFVGTERLRSPFDPYLIILASNVTATLENQYRQ
jgi:4-amino-4-deoxy-L-arabinose transferase-like glycosyltransferase